MQRGPPVGGPEQSPQNERQGSQMSVLVIGAVLIVAWLSVARLLMGPPSPGSSL